MHSTDRKHKSDQMGENIAMKWTSSGDDFTGQQATDQWYSEIERFDFKTAAGPRTGEHKNIRCLNQLRQEIVYSI